MFAQHLSKIRIAVYVDAGTFFAQLCAGSPCGTTALGADVEALTMSTRRAPITCNRDSGTSSPARRASPRQSLRGQRRHTHHRVRDGEFGEPLSGLIVYERLGPRAAGRGCCPPRGGETHRPAAVSRPRIVRPLPGALTARCLERFDRGEGCIVAVNSFPSGGPAPRREADGTEFR